MKLEVSLAISLIIHKDEIRANRNKRTPELQKTIQCKNI